jgi:hypothetical protein
VSPRVALEDAEYNALAASARASGRRAGALHGRRVMSVFELTGLASCLAALAAGCAFSRYEPGTLTAPSRDPNTRSITLGCLDVAMRPTKDALVPTSHPVLRFAVGNRCPQAVPVAFDRVRVEGLYETGPVALFAVDPRNEIHAATLDGHASAVETLEFAPTRTHPNAPASVCVTLSGFTTANVSEVDATRCFVFTRHDPGGAS